MATPNGTGIFAIRKAERFDSISTIRNDNLPFINLPADQITNIQPVGAIGFDKPTNSLWISTGLKWIPVGSPPGVRDTGMIGLAINTTQSVSPVPPATPTIVHLNTDFSDTWPPQTSFIKDTVAYGYLILLTGVYRLNYELNLTNSYSGVQFKSFVTWTEGGIPIFTAADSQYSDSNVDLHRGTSLQGVATALLPAGSFVQLQVQQDGSQTENIIGTVAGGTPTTITRYSYLQIEHIA